MPMAQTGTALHDVLSPSPIKKIPRVTRGETKGGKNSPLPLRLGCRSDPALAPNGQDAAGHLI